MRVTMRILDEESAETVTVGHIREAREQMILARETHLDALAWRLEEQADGTLDMDALLRNFKKFWRLNSETWEEMSDYTEAFPHLLLMAFLQRVTNGEGRIEREYAAGRGRMDLAVEYQGAWNIIEIKVLRKNRTFAAVKEEGLGQIRQYRERINPAAACYLVIFDRRPEKPLWVERGRITGGGKGAWKKTSGSIRLAKNCLTGRFCRSSKGITSGKGVRPKYPITRCFGGYGIF